MGPAAFFFVQAPFFGSPRSWVDGSALDPGAIKDALQGWGGGKPPKFACFPKFLAPRTFSEVPMVWGGDLPSATTVQDQLEVVVCYNPRPLMGSLVFWGEGLGRGGGTDHHENTKPPPFNPMAALVAARGWGID